MVCQTAFTRSSWPRRKSASCSRRRHRDRQNSMLKTDTSLRAPAPLDEPLRMSVDRPGNEEESIAREAVARADAWLAERDASIPKNFAAQLFGRAVPEDIVRYAP